MVSKSSNHTQVSVQLPVVSLALLHWTRDMLAYLASCQMCLSRILVHSTMDLSSQLVLDLQGMSALVLDLQGMSAGFLGPG